MIYDDFRQRHPNLSKGVVSWDPYDYATIVIKCEDGSKLLYNYDEHRARFCLEKERKDIYDRLVY